MYGPPRQRDAETRCRIFNGENVMCRKATRLAIGIGLTGMLLVGIAPVWAAGQDANTATATVMVQGVQVAIDPATGRLVAPTDAQRQALSAAMQTQASRAASNSALQRPMTEADAARTVRHPSTGPYSAVMQLPESLVSSLVAQTQADGSIAIHHQGEGQHAAAAEVTQ